MEAGKVEFLANLDAELDTVNEVMTAPVAARSDGSPKLKRYLFAAAFAIAGPLLLNAAPAAAATVADARTGAEIQSCSDFTTPDFVAYSHTKKCRQITAAFSYKYSQTYNNGTVLCHYFLRTIYMPCALPSQSDVETCRR